MSCKQSTQPNGKQSMELRKEHEEWRIPMIAAMKKANGESICVPINNGGIAVSDRMGYPSIMNSEYPSILPRSFHSRHPVSVARDLLGKLLIRRIDNHTMMSGMITETEAYGPPSEDPLVKTEGVRGLRLDWEPGLAWTTYTMRGKPTLNITTMTPSCVLIRAIEPREGWVLSDVSLTRLTVGPINLAKTLKIDRCLDKTDMTVSGPLFICEGESVAADNIVESKRKNVKIDAEEPRRFFIKWNRFVS